MLEVLSLVMVVQNNYQRAAFFNSANRFTGSVLASYNNITGYFGLKTENRQLMEENIRLRKQIEQSFRITDTSVFIQKDPLFRYIGAKVISNSIGRQKNYIMLDKGKEHGIEPYMGVFTSDGVVGTVVEVSDQYALVMSLLHLLNKTSARIKKNNHIGSVSWGGADYRYGLLSDVPAHVELQPGDTIITSGNSLIFPEGLVIGLVSAPADFDQRSKFKRAPIRFSVDFNKLNHVYIIVNLMKEEQENLLKTYPE
jgi:rod shape-determining protein MreC